MTEAGPEAADQRRLGGFIRGLALLTALGTAAPWVAVATGRPAEAGEAVAATLVLGSLAAGLWVLGGKIRRGSKAAWLIWAWMHFGLALAIWTALTIAWERFAQGAVFWLLVMAYPCTLLLIESRRYHRWVSTGLAILSAALVAWLAFEAWSGAGSDRRPGLGTAAFAMIVSAGSYFTYSWAVRAVAPGWMTAFLRPEEGRGGAEGHPLASYGRRLGGHFLDAFLASLASTPLLMSVAPIFRPKFHGYGPLHGDNLFLSSAFFLGVFYLYEVVFLSRRSRTVGKMILGTWVVDRDGARLGPMTAILRPTVHYSARLLDIMSPLPILLLSYGPIFFRGRKKCLHDYVARTQVLSEASPEAPLAPDSQEASP